MAFATVPVGRYLGFTAAEIRTRLATLKAAVIAQGVGAGAIVATSGNGVSVSFDHRVPGSLTIDQEIADLMTAIALVDDDELPVTPTQTFAA